MESWQSPNREEHSSCFQLTPSTRLNTRRDESDFSELPSVEEGLLTILEEDEKDETGEISCSQLLVNEDTNNSSCNPLLASSTTQEVWNETLFQQNELEFVPLRGIPDLCEVRETQSRQSQLCLSSSEGPSDFCDSTVSGYPRPMPRVCPPTPCDPCCYLSNPVSSYSEHKPLCAPDPCDEFSTSYTADSDECLSSPLSPRRWGAPLKPEMFLSRTCQSTLADDVASIKLSPAFLLSCLEKVRQGISSSSDSSVGGVSFSYKNPEEHETKPKPEGLKSPETKQKKLVDAPPPLSSRFVSSHGQSGQSSLYPGVRPAQLPAGSDGTATRSAYLGPGVRPAQLPAGSDGAAARTGHLGPGVRPAQLLAGSDGAVARTGHLGPGVRPTQLPAGSDGTAARAGHLGPGVRPAQLPAGSDGAATRVGYLGPGMRLTQLTAGSDGAATRMGYLGLGGRPAQLPAGSDGAATRAGHLGPGMRPAQLPAGSDGAGTRAGHLGPGMRPAQLPTGSDGAATRAGHLGPGMRPAQLPVGSDGAGTRAGHLGPGMRPAQLPVGSDGTTTRSAYLGPGMRPAQLPVGSDGAGTRAGHLGPGMRPAQLPAGSDGTTTRSAYLGPGVRPAQLPVGSDGTATRAGYLGPGMRPAQLPAGSDGTATRAGYLGPGVRPAQLPVGSDGTATRAGYLGPGVRPAQLPAGSDGTATRAGYLGPGVRPAQFPVGSDGAATRAGYLGPGVRPAQLPAGSDGAATRAGYLGPGVRPAQLPVGSDGAGTKIGYLGPGVRPAQLPVGSDGATTRVGHLGPGMRPAQLPVASEGAATRAGHLGPGVRPAELPVVSDGAATRAGHLGPGMRPAQLPVDNEGAATRAGYLGPGMRPAQFPVVSEGAAVRAGHLGPGVRPAELPVVSDGASTRPGHLGPGMRPAQLPAGSNGAATRAGHLGPGVRPAQLPVASKGAATRAGHLGPGVRPAQLPVARDGAATRTGHLGPGVRPAQLPVARDGAVTRAGYLGPDMRPAQLPVDSEGAATRAGYLDPGLRPAQLPVDSEGAATRAGYLDPGLRPAQLPVDSEGAATRAGYLDPGLRPAQLPVDSEGAATRAGYLDPGLRPAQLPVDSEGAATRAGYPGPGMRPAQLPVDNDGAETRAGYLGPGVRPAELPVVRNSTATRAGHLGPGVRPAELPVVSDGAVTRVGHLGPGAKPAQLPVDNESAATRVGYLGPDMRPAQLPVDSDGAATGAGYLGPDMRPAQLPVDNESAATRVGYLGPGMRPAQLLVDSEGGATGAGFLGPGMRPAQLPVDSEGGATGAGFLGPGMRPAQLQVDSDGAETGAGYLGPGVRPAQLPVASEGAATGAGYLGPGMRPAQLPGASDGAATGAGGYLDPGLRLVHLPVDSEGAATGAGHHLGPGMRPEHLPVDSEGAVTGPGYLGPGLRPARLPVDNEDAATGAGYLGPGVRPAQLPVPSEGTAPGGGYLGPGVRLAQLPLDSEGTATGAGYLDPGLRPAQLLVTSDSAATRAGYLGPGIRPAQFPVDSDSAAIGAEYPDITFHPVSGQPVPSSPVSIDSPMEALDKIVAFHEVAASIEPARSKTQSIPVQAFLGIDLDWKQNLSSSSSQTEKPLLTQEAQQVLPVTPSVIPRQNITPEASVRTFPVLPKLVSALVLSHEESARPKSPNITVWKAPSSLDNQDVGSQLNVHPLPSIDATSPLGELPHALSQLQVYSSTLTNRIRHALSPSYMSLSEVLQPQASNAVLKDDSNTRSPTLSETGIITSERVTELLRGEKYNMSDVPKPPIAGASQSSHDSARDSKLQAFTGQFREGALDYSVPPSLSQADFYVSTSSTSSKPDPVEPLLSKAEHREYQDGTSQTVPDIQDHTSQTSPEISQTRLSEAPVRQQHFIKPHPCIPVISCVPPVPCVPSVTTLAPRLLCPNTLRIFYKSPRTSSCVRSTFNSGRSHVGQPIVEFPLCRDSVVPTETSWRLDSQKKTVSVVESMPQKQEEQASSSESAPGDIPKSEQAEKRSVPLRIPSTTFYYKEDLKIVSERVQRLIDRWDSELIEISAHTAPKPTLKTVSSGKEATKLTFFESKEIPVTVDKAGKVRSDLQDIKEVSEYESKTDKGLHSLLVEAENNARKRFSNASALRADTVSPWPSRLDDSKEPSLKKDSVGLSQRSTREETLVSTGKVETSALSYFPSQRESGRTSVEEMESKARVAMRETLRQYENARSVPRCDPGRSGAITGHPVPLMPFVDSHSSSDISDGRVSYVWDPFLGYLPAIPSHAYMGDVRDLSDSDDGSSDDSLAAHVEHLLKCESPVSFATQVLRSAEEEECRVRARAWNLKFNLASKYGDFMADLDEEDMRKMEEIKASLFGCERPLDMIQGLPCPVGIRNIPETFCNHLFIEAHDKGCTRNMANDQSESASHGFRSKESAEANQGQSAASWSVQFASHEKPAIQSSQARAWSSSRTGSHQPFLSSTSEALYVSKVATGPFHEEAETQLVRSVGPAPGSSQEPISYPSHPSAGYSEFHRSSQGFCDAPIVVQIDQAQSPVHASKRLTMQALKSPPTITSQALASSLRKDPVLTGIRDRVSIDLSVTTRSFQDRGPPEAPSTKTAAELQLSTKDSWPADPRDLGRGLNAKSLGGKEQSLPSGIAPEEHLKQYRPREVLPGESQGKPGRFSQIPFSQPPLSQPPLSQPPLSQPPLSQPPLSQPPLSQPPLSQPPLSQPPLSQPPLSQPPLSQHRGRIVAEQGQLKQNPRHVAGMEAEADFRIRPSSPPLDGEVSSPFPCSSSKRAISYLRITLSPNPCSGMLNGETFLKRQHTMDAGTRTRLHNSLSVAPCPPKPCLPVPILLCPPESTIPLPDNEFLDCLPHRSGQPLKSFSRQTQVNCSDLEAYSHSKGVPNNDSCVTFDNSRNAYPAPPLKLSSDANTQITTTEGSEKTTISSEIFISSHIPNKPSHGPTAQPSLLPYKPPGSTTMYYVPNSAEPLLYPVAKSDTTVESTHSGSNDAIAPDFPPEALGTRDENVSDIVNIKHKEGIYSKKTKSAWTEEENPTTKSVAESKNQLEAENTTHSVFKSAQFYFHHPVHHHDFFSCCEPWGRGAQLLNSRGVPGLCPSFDTFEDNNGFYPLQTEMDYTRIESYCVNVGGSEERGARQQPDKSHEVRVPTGSPRISFSLAPTLQPSASLNDLWNRFQERQKQQKLPASNSSKELSLVDRLDRLAKVLQKPMMLSLQTSGPAQADGSGEGTWQQQQDTGKHKPKKDENEPHSPCELRWVSRASFVLTGRHQNRPDHPREAGADSMSLISSDSLMPEPLDTMFESDSMTQTDGEADPMGEASSDVSMAQKVLERRHGSPRRQHRQTEGSSRGTKARSTAPQVRRKDIQVDSVTSLDSGSTDSSACSLHPTPRNKQNVRMLNKAVQTGELEMVRSTRKHTQDFGVTFPTPNHNVTEKRADNYVNYSKTGSSSEEKKPLTLYLWTKKSRKSKPNCCEGVSWFIPAENLRCASKKENQASCVRGPGPSWFASLTYSKPWRQPLREKNCQTESRVSCRLQAMSPDLNDDKEAQRRFVKAGLQECLERNRPDFISSSGARVKRLKLITEERKLQHLLQRERDALFNTTEQQKVSQDFACFLSKKGHVTSRNRTITKKEMVQRSKRMYEQLPEVRKKREEEQRRSAYTAYRFKAQLYKMKITNRVLGRKIPWD
uniref:ALMS motif domain-containing protein n=1 Tax=Monodelphis domestica TaxID=13616 RepID=A0A5F8GCI4_MONDO